MLLHVFVGAGRTWETVETVGTLLAVLKPTYTSNPTRTLDCTTSTGDFGLSYQVTTKKNLIIFHDPEEWLIVLVRLEKDFGHAIRMRHIMKRELGFTARDHRGLVPNRRLGGVMDSFAIEDAPGHHYEQQVHLDFYNEASQSWFILKYL
jgi:hypothetical protein